MGFPVDISNILQNGINAIRDAFNASNGLKEGGNTVDKYSFPNYNQLLKEGRIIGNNATNSGLTLPSQVTSGTDRLTYTTFTPISGASFNADVSPGETWVNAKVKIQVDRACTYNGTIKQGSHITQTNELGGFTPISGTFGVNGGTDYIELPALMYEGGVITIAFQSPGTIAKPLEQPIISLSFVAGTSITNDFNYQAKRVVLSVGDSISWAGERIGYYDNSIYKLSGKVMYDQRVCDALRAEGKSVRLVKKGFGSMIQAEADKAYLNGWYDGINYDLVICSRGTNDVPTTITTQAETDFKTSLKNVILHRNKFRPNASIIFIAPFPSDAGTDRINNLATVRQWVQDVSLDSTLGTTTRKVYFYNGNNAFALNATAANDINFALGVNNAAGERVTGSRLHLGQYGHLAAFNGLYPIVQQTNFYTSS